MKTLRWTLALVAGMAHASPAQLASGEIAVNACAPFQLSRLSIPAQSGDRGQWRACGSSESLERHRSIAGSQKSVQGGAACVHALSHFNFGDLIFIHCLPNLPG